MGVYGNSFFLLCDEDGDIDLSKLTEKVAEMEITMKKRIQEIKNQKNIINPLLIPSCHNDEVEGDEWKVHESRRKRDGGGNMGGEAAVGSEKKQVKKKEGESGELEEEQEVYEGLVVEEITKGTQKNLQGYRKGDRVNDIKYLKKYLQRFGYLNYHDKSSSSINYDEDDFFDEKLESAIKTYQTNFNLNPTGFLDSETITMMSRPRCGCQTMFHSHYKFFAGNPKWPSNKTKLTYALQPDDPIDASEPIRKALIEWGKYTRFTYEKINDFGTADIKIGFYRGDHGDCCPFNGPGARTYAHAFAPTYGQLHFNLNQTWVNGVVEGGVDLMTVGLHELGHVLGLDHSTVEAAIMWPYLGAGATKGLNADDIQGIQALYA
ncbi:hypothetical protein Dsin_018814 [Dipteronia sinensis]|uniref:Peptidase metallopeptidase domain-containing protein n=1 Tax=Dipteronia sinensis TaxID=43782 RepID=A0AAE0A7G0_9ROSI|nr:hypothetical protein Dsin_018814 [Dipteronia sinensis]